VETKKNTERVRVRVRVKVISQNATQTALRGTLKTLGERYWQVV